MIVPAADRKAGNLHSCCPYGLRRQGRPPHGRRRAFALANVSVLAPVGYSSLVFATLIGWVFFDEVPTRGLIVGAGFVVVGGSVLALSRR